MELMLHAGCLSLSVGPIQVIICSLPLIDIYILEVVEIINIFLTALIVVSSISQLSRCYVHSHAWVTGVFIIFY